MIVNLLAAKFAKLESAIAAERGDFAFFALFLREDAPDVWDLIVSAPWASANKKEALDYFVEKIKADLGPSSLIQLSQIVVVDPADPALQNLTMAIQVEHGTIEVRDSNFFGMPIKHAFIITSKSLSAAVV